MHFVIQLFQKNLESISLEMYLLKDYRCGYYVLEFALEKSGSEMEAILSPRYEFSYISQNHNLLYTELVLVHL